MRHAELLQLQVLLLEAVQVSAVSLEMRLVVVLEPPDLQLDVLDLLLLLAQRSLQQLLLLAQRLKLLRLQHHVLLLLSHLPLPILLPLYCCRRLVHALHLQQPQQVPKLVLVRFVLHVQGLSLLMLEFEALLELVFVLTQRTPADLGFNCAFARLGPLGPECADGQLAAADELAPPLALFN